MLAAPTELLTTFERPLRSPLPTIVEHLHAILDELPSPDENPAAYCDALARCFNQASLLEVHFGRSAMAYSLCSRELQWIAALARATGMRGLLVYGFQPWINLARLDRLHGRPNQARDRLAALAHALAARRVDIGSLVVSVSDWPALLETMPRLPEILAMVWICETLLCGLHSRRYETFDCVDRFVADNAADPHIALVEARLIAARLPDGPAVPAGAGCELETLSQLKRHSLMIRRLELDAAQSLQRDDVSTRTAAIAECNLAAGIGCWHLAIVQHCVALLLKLDRDAAMPIAECAHAAADRLGDEIFSAWFADACIEASSGAQEWVGRRSVLSDRSWYARIRTESQATHASRLECIDALHRRVVSVSMGKK
jgi:hypothetical protein